MPSKSLYTWAIVISFFNVIALSINIIQFTSFVCGLNTFFIMLCGYKLTVLMAEEYAKNKNK